MERYWKIEMGSVFNILALLSLIFLAACTSKPIAIETEEGIQEDLQLLAGSTSKYYRYNEAHFEKSRAEGKVIFLDYHANWCPICARDNPKILEAFNQLDDTNIVGYQAHYNDGETNDEDKKSAKNNGISSQYTKVILNKDGEISLKTLEILDTERIINELEKAAGE